MKCFTLAFVLLSIVHCALCNLDSRAKGNKDGSKSMSPLQLYQRLFVQKRLQQKEALKTIVALDDFTKQYKMINMIFKQLFEVLSAAKTLLMQVGYSPGDSFPVNETVREYLSSVAENTAFFGDILLRFPDISHAIYDQQHTWNVTMAWSVGLCEEAHIFDGSNKMLLNLMSQELNIIEKDKEYVNPYKSDIEKERKKMEPTAENKKIKKKKKKKRGPSLSRVEL